MREIQTYAPDAIAAFLEAAERRAAPDRVVVVRRRKKNSKRVEEYTQRYGPDPAPISEWALLLACTGLRRGEAGRLRWADVDLDQGVLRVFATKTGAFRYVPLIGDPSGDVSPGFVDVLRTWRRAHPDDTHVLPGAPHYPNHSWDATSKDSGSHLTPQGLRRTFESTLAVIGFPASLAAFWLGHSVQVAEAHYRTYRPGRLPGATVDAALGLTPYLEREARGPGALHALPPAEEA